MIILVQIQGQVQIQVSQLLLITMMRSGFQQLEQVQQHGHLRRRLGRSSTTLITARMEWVVNMELKLVQERKVWDGLKHRMMTGQLLECLLQQIRHLLFLSIPQLTHLPTLTPRQRLILLEPIRKVAIFGIEYK